MKMWNDILFVDREIHFHCLDEEGYKRFAYICHAPEGCFNSLTELDERLQKAIARTMNI